MEKTCTACGVVTEMHGQIPKKFASELELQIEFLDIVIIFFSNFSDLGMMKSSNIHGM